MNEKKAKAIRKHVYNDHSLRGDRKYTWGGGAMIVMGLRATYQKAKKEYYRRMRYGYNRT